MIYHLYIFDRHCQCLLNHEFPKVSNQTESSSTSTTSLAFSAATRRVLGGHRRISSMNQAEEKTSNEVENLPSVFSNMTESEKDEHAKLVYGLIFSLKNMCGKLSVTGSNKFISFKTSMYKLHLFETASGLKFVLITDPYQENLQGMLKNIYESVYVEYHVKNPNQSAANLSKGSVITSELFKSQLNKLVVGHYFLFPSYFL
ncbi:snare-like protein [Rozella allomycis CSF55]|uniref:Trafficking protein particle complex subunit n=1 Tax=Rozella allomycis (strain CSF55) TaxID=988480 RepID=A0A075AQ25_ROZAC|nr:Sybindin-like protein domain-containing protein [Rozella allomycis CSF55]RKP21041.1 snare-like protein [Rozella allomycis CSF55]|eukprot:EPZ32303.1 Sybindin-like protein domain-containing protein [Rozella allomycis CSF55]